MRNLGLGCLGNDPFRSLIYINAVTIGCSSTSSENCTYFESNGFSTGGCSATICPANNNVCQLRLDFETFVIAGPSTATATFELLNGAPNAGGGAATLASQCSTDSFSVSNSFGGNFNTICGTNSNDHSTYQCYNKAIILNAHCQI